MATFCPARGAALPSVQDRSLPRVVGLVLVQGSVSPSHTHVHDYHTHILFTHVTLTVSVHSFSLLARWQSGMVVGPRERERVWVLLALRWVSLACREGGGLRKPEEPASKPRSARIRAPWSPARVGYRLHTPLPPPVSKWSCLIFNDQG